MRNIKLTIQYDGTAYHGWQIQSNALTIQEVIEKSILRVTGERPKVTGCGRTDAGVHALNYVCNFFSDTKIPINKIAAALNSGLPPDIVCKSAQEVPMNFHAADSAVKKRYTYRILNSEFNDAFMNKYVWHLRGTLDFDNMVKASKAFLGEHDFLGFASSGFSVKTTVRTIYSLELNKSGELITMDITGNGFLYNMVRIIAGTLVFVGCGKIKAEDMEKIILSRDRRKAGITAPASGLFLSEVYYWEE